MEARTLPLEVWTKRKSKFFFRERNVEKIKKKLPRKMPQDPKFCSY